MGLRSRVSWGLGAGWWYWVVTVASAGLLAWVPFTHAAARLKTLRARRLAAAFAVADVLLVVLFALAPQDDQGRADGPVGVLGGLLAIGTVVAACVLVRPLRRALRSDTESEQAARVRAEEPAVAAVLAARARRAEARELAAADPLLARELGVGRPDLGRGYDDGGLVDLNSAPAETIAAACAVPAETAALVVALRDRRGVGFASTDEVFVLADIPAAEWDRIRDRAVLIP